MASWLTTTGVLFLDPADERGFKTQFIVNRVPVTRLFLVLSACLYYSFFVWDRIIDPVSWETTHFIRGAVVIPIMLACASILLIPAAVRFAEWVVMIAWICAILGLAAIYTVLRSGFDFGSVGIVLVIMGAPMMLAMRVPFVVAGSLFGIVSFLGAHSFSGNARDGMMIVNAFCVVTAAIIVVFASFVHEREARQRFSAEKELLAARERVNELLHSILPQDIVQRIQAGETAIADAYGEVSIIFADLVGFTAVSRQVSPTHLVEILNVMFSRFDALADRHNIEKIKTIGDAYMAVGGLSHQAGATDHAFRSADFAIAMQEAVEELKEKTGLPFNVRIGLHVGPVVAGVIGTKRPAFDCWGESVNLASRLEHNAAPGGILISESAYWRLKGSYKITVLDEIELRGIGAAKVFLLEGKKDLRLTA